MHLFAMWAGANALVLKEFQFNYNGPVYVRIVGRRAGLFAFIMTLLGIDTKTVFCVYCDRIEYMQSSLSGKTNTIIPLCSLSVMTSAYCKPFIYKVLGALGISLGILWCIFANGDARLLGLFPLIFGVVCLVLYFFNKTVFVSVVSHSSWQASICFKRSIIEGVTFDYDQAQEVLRIIKLLIMRKASEEE